MPAMPEIPDAPDIPDVPDLPDVPGLPRTPGLPTIMSVLAATALIIVGLCLMAGWLGRSAARVTSQAGPDADRPPSV
jgi:hypothetical protein